MLFIVITRVSCIHISKNLMFHFRLKHLMLDIVFESKQLCLEKIYTNENELDKLTKCLPKKKLEAYRQRVGVVEPTT